MAGVATSLSIQDKMTGTYNKIVSAGDRLNRSLETTNRLSDQVDPGAGFSRASAPIDAAGRKVDDFNDKQEKAERGASGLGAVWSKLGPMIASAAAAFGVKQIVGLADTMTQTTARLNLMNDGLQTTAELQDKIMASAQRSRAEYQTTADMVSKLGMQAGGAFKSNDELIAFAEQLNKTFVIAGTDASGIDSTMYNLTQALASGVLRGQDLNAVMSNAMPIVQNIADYMGVTVGKIRDMAADGKLSAQVVKNAMLAAAADTNETFQKIPMTFSQVGTIVANATLQTFQPVIQAIGHGAQWIYDNWSMLAPIFYGLAVAVGIYAASLGIQALATWVADEATKKFFATLLTNPMFWIALAIGVVIGLIYKWVQSVGGLKIAWMIVCNAMLTAWDWVKMGFFTGIHWVLDLIDKLKLGWQTANVAIANFMGDMKANVLMILQNMVNGAIDIINGFVKTLNKIPGVNIAMVEQVTFGTSAQLENIAAKQARNAGLEEYRTQIEGQIAERDKALNQMKSAAEAATALRETEIAAAKAAKAQEQADGNTEVMLDYTPYGELERVGEVGKIKDDVNIAEEDLKFLRDVAEMRYVQNFVTLTPTVSLEVGTVNENADVDRLVAEVERRLEEEFAAAAEGEYN